MKKKTLQLGVLASLFLLLAGCMYPASEKQENKIPYADQINSVQNAVDAFREEQGGLLPIKNQDQSVPIYQKYPIDFKKLTKYLSEPPGNAYESGGVFQYVLINAETDPEVRVFDLRVADALQEYRLRLQMYLDNNEYLPFKEQLSTYVFTLDHEKLGYDDVPIIKSPYSEAELHIIVNSDYEVYIDYTPDLIKALEEKEHDFAQGDDIRDILAEDSLIVPAYSLPYTIDEDNNPIFLSK